VRNVLLNSVDSVYTRIFSIFDVISGHFIHNESVLFSIEIHVAKNPSFLGLERETVFPLVDG
jgi:hypothetical protein